jgi:hypothetical protein
VSELSSGKLHRRFRSVISLRGKPAEIQQWLEFGAEAVDGALAAAASQLDTAGERVGAFLPISRYHSNLRFGQNIAPSHANCFAGGLLLTPGFHPSGFWIVTRPEIEEYLQKRSEPPSTGSGRAPSRSNRRRNEALTRGAARRRKVGHN